MSSILPFASGHHPVWFPMANEIHAAIWDRVGLGKVQGFVREWASAWVARLNAAEAARQEKFAQARQALHYPNDSTLTTLNRIADNSPDDWQRKEPLWEPDRPELPLPPSHRSRSPAEKWAALAAVHDVFDLTGDKVLPWPLPEDNQDLVALREWDQGGGGAYRVLMRAASALIDTDADPVGRWLEDVKLGGAPAAGDPQRAAAPIPEADAGAGGDGEQPQDAGDGELPECLVTLQQAAAMVNRTKRTVEDWKGKKGFPRPRVIGGGGKPHEYAWSELRPVLERLSGRELPERFPAQRFRPT